jgi:outer membrane protein TolC
MLCSTAQAGDLSIRFDELESFAWDKSPRARILAEELEKLRARKDYALQWSNPQVAYDREEVNESGEFQVTLRKSLVTPTKHGKLRDGWEERIRAGELGADQEAANLLSELKAGYVRLRLLDAYLERLENLGEIVSEASAVAATRHDEGELSGVDRHLIQLSALSVDANRQRAFQERREVAAAWLADMGSPEGTPSLVTPIKYKPVNLASTQEYADRLADTPGVRSRGALRQSLAKRAEAARPSLLPGLDLYAGYKRIEPADDGLVAGIAVSLPLFDRKAAAAREIEAERRIVEHETALYRSRSIGAIEALVHSIEDAGPALSIVAARLDESPPMMTSLLYSYEVGRLSLDAFLGAIQIEVTGLKDYYDQLSTYYQNIFQLEAIAGAQIVSFAQ